VEEILETNSGSRRGLNLSALLILLRILIPDDRRRTGNVRFPCFEFCASRSAERVSLGIEKIVVAAAAACFLVQSAHFHSFVVHLRSVSFPPLRPEVPSAARIPHPETTQNSHSNSDDSVSAPERPAEEGVQKGCCVVVGKAGMR
jgi:hypothetical protein